LFLFPHPYLFLSSGFSATGLGLFPAPTLAPPPPALDGGFNGLDGGA